jgi:agmatine deiminase
MEKEMKRMMEPPCYRMPAEWERHDATWLCWPTNRTDWPGTFEPIPWVFAEMAKKLSDGEIVRIIVQSAEHEKKVKLIFKQQGVDLQRIEFFRFPTNRGWTRDMGPIFTQRSPENDIAVLRFRFRAWSKYSDWKKDDQVHLRAAKALKIPVVPVTYKGEEVELERQYRCQWKWNGADDRGMFIASGYPSAQSGIHTRRL